MAETQFSRLLRQFADQVANQQKPAANQENAGNSKPKQKQNIDIPKSEFEFFEVDNPDIFNDQNTSDLAKMLNDNNVEFDEQTIKDVEQLGPSFSMMSDEDRSRARDNQMNKTLEIDTSNVSEPDIDQQVNDRFSRQRSGSQKEGTAIDRWIDNTTGQEISNDDKAAAEAQMRTDYATRLAERNGNPDSGTADAIANVASGNANGNPLDNRDFSDDYAAYMSNAGLGYSDAGDFMFNGTIDDWRNFVQGEMIRDWYEDLFDANGNLDENAFTNWFNENKKRTANDLYDMSDGSYSTFAGGDYDTFMDIAGYLYDNNNEFGYSNAAGDFAPDQDDRQAVLDALAYEYGANAATRALADGYDGDFAQQFKVGDMNRFIGNDDFEIGAIMDGYESADDLGRTNVSPNILMTGAFDYNDGSGRILPVQGAIDNILAAYGQGYGAKKRSR